MRATGALFFTGFGALWLALGLAAAHQLSLLIITASAVPVGVLALWARRLLKASSKIPPSPQNLQQQQEVQKTFNRINTVQWVAVVAAMILLNVLRLQPFIASAIAIIVGFHLFPLARLFDNSSHYVTGTLLILWPITVMVWASREHVPSLSCLGAAAILLSSAAYALAVATRAGHEPCQ